MRFTRFFLGTGLLLAAAALTAGCGKEAKFKIVPVEGKLTFSDGSPLPTGTLLRLDPVEGGAATATGELDSSGSFKLTHASGKTGAEVGKYTVSLVAPKDQGASFYKMIPKDFYDGTALFAEVKEGMAPLQYKVPKARQR